MTQPTLYGEPMHVPHAKGSRTSRQAAEAISQQPAKRESKAQRLLHVYVAAGARGCTDAEASEATSLLVMDGYTRRAGPFGHSQVVWTATSRGREQAR